jgi:hypothetical protein
VPFIAVHELGEVHDTPVRLVEMSEATLCNVQAVPSQDAARVPPTAVQAVIEAHDTALKEPPGA